MAGSLGVYLTKQHSRDCDNIHKPLSTLQTAIKKLFSFLLLASKAETY
jgi:hypothetical protein